MKFAVRGNNRKVTNNRKKQVVCFAPLLQSARKGNFLSGKSLFVKSSDLLEPFGKRENKAACGEIALS